MGGDTRTNSARVTTAVGREGRGLKKKGLPPQRRDPDKIRVTRAQIPEERSHFRITSREMRRTSSDGLETLKIRLLVREGKGFGGKKKEDETQISRERAQVGACREGSVSGETIHCMHKPTLGHRSQGDETVGSREGAWPTKKYLYGVQSADGTLKLKTGRIERVKGKRVSGMLKGASPQAVWRSLARTIKVKKMKPEKKKKRQHRVRRTL